MNQFNALIGAEPTEPPREWNSQPLEFHFKSWKYPPKTSPVILSIMGRINNNSVDNGDVEVYPSEYPFKSTSDLVLDPETTMIKSIDDDEMDQLM